MKKRLLEREGGGRKLVSNVGKYIYQFVTLRYRRLESWLRFVVRKASFTPKFVHLIDAAVN